MFLKNIKIKKDAIFPEVGSRRQSEALGQDFTVIRPHRSAPGQAANRGDYMSRVLHVWNPSSQENYLDDLIY